MSDMLSAMAQQAKHPNVPILGQPKEKEQDPIFQLVVFPIRDNDEPPFGAAMGLTEEALRYVMKNQDDLDEWFGKPENQKAVQMVYIERAMGCLLAMGKQLDPFFDLRRAKVRERIEAMEPKSRERTPEEKQEAADNLEAAKAEFLRMNPQFDPAILEHQDIELMKKKIEQARGGEMEFHQDHPQEGGGLVPPGEFKPRHPKVLNPHIEIINPAMLEG